MMRLDKLDGNEIGLVAQNVEKCVRDDAAPQAMADMRADSQEGITDDGGLQC